MGGRIWVESKAGSGSVFHFHARFGLQKNPVPLEEIDLAELAGLPVLVVDGNATSRRLLQGMLTGWGMNPTLAARGPEALALLEKAKRSGFPSPWCCSMLIFRK